MPTLERRVGDGEYYIRHFFHEHHTWQVVGEGVRALRNRGITEGKYFSTDLFMDLLTKGLVYHGCVIPKPMLPCCDSGVKGEFQKEIAEFYRLVYTQQADVAWTFVAEPVLEDEDRCDPVSALARFKSDVRELCLVNWKCTDCQLFEIDLRVPQVDGSTFEATRLGVAHIRLSLKLGRRYLQQYWLQAQGGWRVMWRGFQSPAA